MAESYPGGAKWTGKKYSTRGVSEGARSGTIVHVWRKGTRVFQKVKVKLDAGGHEEACFQPELILDPGDKVTYEVKADGRCTTGSRARNVKIH